MTRNYSNILDLLLLPLQCQFSHTAIGSLSQGSISAGIKSPCSKKLFIHNVVFKRDQSAKPMIVFD